LLEIEQKSTKHIHTQQIYVQPSTAAVNATLSALAVVRRAAAPLLLSAEVYY